MPVPETRASLLLKLRDPRDQSAWDTFLQIYQPLIFRLARRRGVQEADAREITQEVLITVAGAIGRWDTDPARGSFRGWLSKMTRNLVVNFFIRQSRHPRGSGDSNLKRLSDASLITGRWTVRPEKPGDKPGTCLIESRFIRTFNLAYELDAGTSPKQLSLYEFESTGDGLGGGGRQSRREIPGSRCLGIYELTETELRLQFSKPGEPRPTEFVSDQSQLPAGQNLLTLNRKLDDRLLKPLP